MATDISKDVLKIVKHNSGDVKWHSLSSGSMMVSYPSGSHRDNSSKMLSQLTSITKTLNSNDTSHLIHYKFSVPPRTSKVKK